MMNRVKVKNLNEKEFMAIKFGMLMKQVCGGFQWRESLKWVI